MVALHVLLTAQNQRNRLVNHVIAQQQYCFLLVTNSAGAAVFEINRATINFLSTSLQHTIRSHFAGSLFAVVVGNKVHVNSLSMAAVITDSSVEIAAVTEKLVPFMAIAYVIGALVIFFANIGHVGAVFTAIFKGAFGLRAVGGGIVGSGVKLALTWGMKRGVFSNEAGLGSSVMVHSSSNVKEPVRQGMWGIFEVFADTMVVCTLTAFAVLSSGLIDLDTGAVLVDVSGSALVGQAFATVFGSFGPAFIAIAILLFAFSTVLGWSHYGSKACEYLFGTKSTIVYKVVFVLMIFIGCTMNLGLAWDLSDTFNGLMAIPNLIGVIALSPVVMKITKNYVARIIKKEDVKPMLSVFPEIQEEQEKAM